MKKWILENTNIIEEKYDEVMKYQRDDINNTPNGLFHEPKKQIMNFIELFTLKRNHLNFKEVKYDGKWFLYRNIKFRLLYEILKDEELFTKLRYGKCHDKSYALAFGTSFVDIVTGICKDIYGYEYLHTFLIQTSPSKEEFVLDYTKNLIMKKEDYYDLLDVVVINELKNADFRNYMENILKNEVITENVTLPEFFCFPKEINDAALNIERKNKPIQRT